MDLLQRIDQAIAKNPNDPFITGELQTLLADCRREIERLAALAGVSATGETFAEMKKRINCAPHPSDEERN